MTMNLTRRHDEPQIAKLDRPTALSDLFSMQGGAVDFTAQTRINGDEATIRIEAKERLGPSEAATQDTLLAIGLVAMNLGFRRGEDHKIVVECTIADLARQMLDEHQAGFTFVQIKESLVKLAGVTVHVDKSAKNGKYKPYWTDNLISVISDTNGKMTIRIHPVFSLILAGGPGYIQVDMSERMQLSPTGRLMHMHICSRINRGAEGRILIGDLFSSVWGDNRVNRDRKEALNRTLDKLEYGLGGFRR
jgi:hypothetical protein